MSAEKTLGKVGRMALDFLTAPVEPEEVGKAALHAFGQATGTSAAVTEAKLEHIKQVARQLADQVVPPEFLNDPGAQDPLEEDEQPSAFDVDGDAIETTGEAAP